MSLLISPVADAPEYASAHELAPPQWLSDRWAKAAVWILILYTAARNLLDAAAKPFWFDELATVAVAGQADLPSMWRAFDRAQDSSTPLFCVVEHFFGNIIPRQEIAYRLPSILGFGCVLWCLFVFVRRRFGSDVALLSAIIPILTLLYRPYAIEARGYTAVIAFISIAMVCYQRASERAWLLLMAFSLIVAGAFHYYGFFGLAPFGMTEVMFLLRRKQFRWGVWLSIFVGLLPVIAAFRRATELKRFYGSHFWGKPDLSSALTAYSSIFRTTFPLAIGACVALCAVLVWVMLTPDSFGSPETKDHSHEAMLAVGLLGLVLVEFIVTKVAQGTLVDRYALGTVLGVAVAVAYAARVFGRRSLAVLAILACGALFSQETYYWSFESGPFGKLASPVLPVRALVNAAGRDDLPVAVSDGQQYMMLAFYGSPQWSRRFVGLADPAAAVYAGTDSVDRQMLALRCCLGVQIYPFREFSTVHTAFLLYSDASMFDWWPEALSGNGYSLKLLVMRGNAKVYLVEKLPLDSSVAH